MAQPPTSHPLAVGFAQFVVGHWLDSLGHSIIVAPGERRERAERGVEDAEVLEVGIMELTWGYWGGGIVQ